VKVPLASIKPPGAVNFHRVLQYAKLPGETAPPIKLIRGNEIEDGSHRWAAAYLRGDEFIEVES
jgi:hypothetical protein